MRLVLCGGLDPEGHARSVLACPGAGHRCQNGGMATLFTRIIDGEIPGTFVWKDDECVAFLSINPITPGHTLVVPRMEVDHWIDLPDELCRHLMSVGRTIGRAQQQAFDCGADRPDHRRLRDPPHPPARVPDHGHGPDRASPTRPPRSRRRSWTTRGRSHPGGALPPPPDGGCRFAAMGDMVDFTSNGGTASGYLVTAGERFGAGRPRDPGVVGPRLGRSRRWRTASARRASWRWRPTCTTASWPGTTRWTRPRS